MLKKGKIGARQFTILVMLYIIGNAILLIPSTLASVAKQDAWIAAMLAVGAALLVIPLCVALGNRFPNMTFTEYLEEIIGKWLGKAVSLLFLLGFPFVIASMTLRNIGDFMTTQTIPETPIQMVHIIYMAVVVMGVRHGLEPLARAAEIFFPLVVLLFLILVVFISPQMKFVNILPVMEGGIQAVLKAALPFFSFPLLEPVILLMIFPHVNDRAKAGKALFAGVLLGGIVLCVTTMMTILVLGADQTARNVFPSYVAAKNINIGQFLERIEMILAVLWIVTSFFRLTLLFHISTFGIAQTLNLKDDRFLTLPLAMILVVLSIVVLPHITYLINFNPVWGVYAPTYGLVLPLLLLGIAIIRKKRSNESNDRYDEGRR
ncbi:GerAB/ArcD/ProY family transporter [Paenibacillus cymbidii]|uniref:GerAB/ArcD/ProY family transporter n=1 Tax=Paenibacillus cymbidii TaxID=1639034 RepID=UPI001080F424|nr:endospore germination permease [Paenibacillus cymbidii]